MNRVLLMVPHEDDEALAGGPMLVNLCRHGYEVFVYIATNGDYYPFESAERAGESLKALKLMGVEPGNVFFGGYGDTWLGRGIYDSDYLEEKTSAAGYRETHGPAEGIDEWHFIREKKHAPYTKSAYLEDICELIDSLRPDVLISVGFDKHPDHRALYLLTLEALSILMVKDSSYSPAFLEKFAYDGNLWGVNDFFRFPHHISAPPEDLEAPYYDWDQRICYRVPKDCNTFFLTSNLMFKVLRSYRTQRMWTMADRVINSDIVYWQRYMDSRLKGADITASSGEVRWLCDNKFIEPVRADEEYCDLAKLCFRPEAEDPEKKVSVKLREPSDLRLILLYFNTPGGIETDVKLKLFCNDGSEQSVCRSYESRKDFSVLKIELEGRSCCGFDLSFEKVKGSLGLGEIEALEEVPGPPFEEFVTRPQEREKSIFFTGILQFEKLLFGAAKCISRIKTPYDRKKERYDRIHSRDYAEGDY